MTAVYHTEFKVSMCWHAFHKPIFSQFLRKRGQEHEILNECCGVLTSALCRHPPGCSPAFPSHQKKRNKIR